MADAAAGLRPAVSVFDWVGLLLICIVLPAVLTPLAAMPLRRAGWIKDGDLTLS